MVDDTISVFFLSSVCIGFPEFALDEQLSSILIVFQSPIMSISTKILRINCII